MSPSEKPWKTLIRIGRLKIGPTAVRKPAHIQFVIPGWDPKQVIEMPFWGLPKALRDKVLSHFSTTVNESYRCFAEVNIGAEKWEDLKFTNWEVNDDKDQS